MSVFSLTGDLCRIPSPSGDELALGDDLCRRLSRFDIRRQQVGDRFNVIATRGKPRIVLTTHMDTVPGRLPVYEDDDFVYGRGACDAKGAMAAMLCAAEQALDEGLTDFGLVFDVGEESDFAGVKKAVDAVEPQVVIVGEPTGCGLVVGQKGLIIGRIVCEGRSAPGATPKKGVSAIMMLVDRLDALRKIALPLDPVLGETTLNVGLVKGGTAGNVVPAAAEASFEIRATRSTKEIIALLEAALPAGCLVIDERFEPVLSSSATFCFLGVPSSVAQYFTEMAFWRGKDVVVLGPGSYDVAHSAEERVEKVQLSRAVGMYLALLRRFTCA